MNGEEARAPDPAQRYEKERRRTNAWYALLYFVIWPFFHLFRPLRVVGRENIPEGPAVICPNHSTFGDPFYAVFAFTRKYPLRTMAKIQVMQMPFIGWILARAGVFGVDRGHADVKAVKTALRYLRHGEKLLIFPEGTRVHEGESVEAKGGAALFAARTGSPLVPVYITPRKRLFRRNTVVIGQPYHPSFAGRRPTAEELDTISADLMARVRALGEGQP